MSASGIISTVSNIRTIGIVIAIIIVVVFAWKISNDLKNPLKGLFGQASGITTESSQETIRDEIDQTEQALKDSQVNLKEQTLDQLDKNRDIILDKEQDTTEQVKRVVEKENAEGEARILDELAELEERFNARIDLFESPEEDAETLQRLQNSWYKFEAGRPLESWELAELNDAILSGIITINNNTGVVTYNF